MNQPWAVGGGPDERTLRRLIEDEHHNDAEVAELYGVARQTAAYWRLKSGILTPGPGNGARPRRRDRVSHKDLIHWAVRAKDANNPIRKRLVEVSLRNQGVPLAADAAGRADDFLAFLETENVVVDYDPLHSDKHGDPAPFFFVPRDPTRDAPGDIVRR